MNVALNRQKLGVEDLAWGTGTQEQTRGGVIGTITEINAQNIPYDGVSTLGDVVSSINLAEWEAEAARLTAVSYATEAEDVVVNIVTSDGDGTYTYTPQVGVYSALHYEIKAGLSETAAGLSETAAGLSETNAQLSEWEAEAAKLTAYSYATEAEDTFVNLVTSDGDGTFTYTPTTDYSSLHWAAKAATFNPALYALLTGATFTGQVKGITPISAADLTRKDYVDGLNSTNVKLTGNQTISGVKTFQNEIISNSNITAGQDSGSVSLTVNDGQGNANVTFNHKGGIPDIEGGSSARITSSVDTPTASMTFQLKSNTVKGTSVTLTSILALNESGSAFYTPLTVPTPTTDFQATTARSTNITVNVGTGQTYTTINQALEYLSGFYPLYKKSGITAAINLKAGFVMEEQVLVGGLNLGWITIVGEDVETIITHTALTTAFNGTHYPAFGVDKGGTSPVIGQLFRFNVEKVGGNKHGIMAVGAGSSADVLSGKGFIGAGTFGVYAINGSTINAGGANASNAGTHGIIAGDSSTINANSANASNAGTYGIYAVAGSTINAVNAIIQNQTTGTAIVRVADGSHIEASGINTTGGTVTVLSQTANTLTGNGIIYQ